MPDFVPAPATLPAGTRVYAIGDIHGCLEPLTALHALIARDLAERPVETSVVIHLGDYVDRGPDSADVVALLAGDPPIAGAQVVNLMGNHEDMMVTAVTSGQTADAVQWLRNGGAETLLSWGIPRAVPQAEWAARIAPSHLAFLGALALSHRVGPYLFVHAGIRPGVALHQQKRDDMLWVREPFLSSKKDHGAVIVHGHTPAKEPSMRPNRIGIDTGAVMGGMLTALVLEADQMAFFQV